MNMTNAASHLRNVLYHNSFMNNFKNHILKLSILQE